MRTELPFVDEWETSVDAPADRAFLSVARRVGLGFDGWFPRVFSRVLGCANQGASFSVPPAVGQEASGFRVAKVDRPSELILEGSHRFAAYRLSFFVDSLGEDRSRVRARTEALFPGAKGAAYRALVIGSRAHAFIVKRMLASIAAHAARHRGDS